MPGNNLITKDLGAVSAYAQAVEAGFTGTQEDWVQRISQSAKQEDMTTVETGLTDLTNTVNQKEAALNSALVHKPVAPLSPDGTDGQLLRTHGDGTTEWVDEGLPTDAQTATAVTAWLDAHPEATTTVQDGAITRAKLDADLQEKTDMVPDLNRALKSSIVNEQVYGASDAMLYGNRNSTTRNGITFTFNSDGSCTVSGTATNTAYVDYYINANSLPDWLRPNVQYHLTYSSENVNFRITLTDNEVWSSTNLVNTKQDIDFIIPETATGILIRLAVASGKTVNETVDPHLYIGVKNAELADGVNSAIKVKIGSYSGTSVNDISENSVYICDGTVVNDLPNNTRAFVVETVFFSLAKGSGQQTAFNFTSGELYWRKKVSGAWMNWMQLDENAIKNRGVLPGCDLNTVLDSGVYLLSNETTYDNSPIELGSLFVFTYSSMVSIQLAIDFDAGSAYYRKRSGSAGTWKQWIAYDDKHDVSIPTKYVAFGDSVTWGAIWELKDSQGNAKPYYQAEFKYQIPTRIAIACGMENNVVNEGVGGTGYYNRSSAGQSVTEKIIAYDFTDAELVTVMAGVNDRQFTPLGTASDTASDETICGAIKRIIDHFATNWPAVQLIIIQPTPSGHVPDPWGGRGSSLLWSLNEFDEQVSVLCHNEHIGYVNWWESNICKQWDLFSGGYSYNQGTGVINGPNYSHMTNELDSAKIGDFIAGKVSRLFHGRN